MDSITQAALGAAVGEAVLGRRVGAKAAAWGAALGTLPDLDVVVSPFVSPVAALYIHRGLTHGLLFGLVVGPLVGLGLARLHRKEGVGWTRWALLATLALVTHPLLDSLTVYGTQLLNPFTDLPVSLAAVSIIDPLYTVPLLAGLVTALRRRGRPRAWANGLGLLVSTAYLAWALGAKGHVTERFEDALAAEGHAYDDLLTAPTLGNTLLWTALATDATGTWVGLYSLLDDAPIRFERVAKRPELLAPYADDLPVERLFWFSRGYYAAERRADSLLVHDLRFGRLDLWMTRQAPYVFTFRLVRGVEGGVTSFEQLSPPVEGVDWDAFRQRVLGREER